jgi:hypothetical protein
MLRALRNAERDLINELGNKTIQNKTETPTSDV